MDISQFARNHKFPLIGAALAMVVVAIASRSLYRSSTASAASQTCIDASRESLSARGYKVRVSKVKELKANGRAGYVSVSVSDATPTDNASMVVLTCSDDGTTSRSERYQLLDPQDGQPPILTLEQQTGHDASGQAVTATATLPLRLSADEAEMVRRENAREGFANAEVPPIGRVSARLVPSDKLTGLAVKVLRDSESSPIDAEGALTLPPSLTPQP